MEPTNSTEQTLDVQTDENQTNQDVVPIDNNACDAPAVDAVNDELQDVIVDPSQSEPIPDAEVVEEVKNDPEEQILQEQQQDVIVDAAGEGADEYQQSALDSPPETSDPTPAEQPPIDESTVVEPIEQEPENKIQFNVGDVVTCVYEFTPTGGKSFVLSVEFCTIQSLSRYC